MLNMLNNLSCIVITCPTLSSVIATEKEISFLKKKNRIPNSLTVLIIEDPVKNIGSGAATLNALLVATEYLSVQNNYMVLSSDVLNGAHVLILHNGRNCLYSGSGKAFIPLPLEWPSNLQNKSKPYISGILSNLESTLMLFDELADESPAGVWVWSTDMMILHEPQTLAIHWESVADVIMFCIPSEIEYATGHGVVTVDEKGFIADIFYCGSMDQIKGLSQGDGKVPLVSGIVFFKTNVAESLLSLNVQAPLDSCTYLGLDSGADPIQVSLFFDLLVAMSSCMTENEFISGRCGKTYNIKVGINGGNSKESLLARSLVWEELSKYKMSPKILHGCQHLYWSSEESAEKHMANLFKIASTERVHALYEVKNDSSLPKHLIVNSSIQAQHCKISSGVIIFDSLIEAGTVSIGENSYISGITFLENEHVLNIPSHLTIINVFIENSAEHNVILIFGVSENPLVPVNLNNGIFCNKPWLSLMKRLDITDEEIWGTELEPKQRNLLNAKLFPSNFTLEEILYIFQGSDDPDLSILFKIRERWKTCQRFSFCDVLKFIHYSKQFEYRRHVYGTVTSGIIRNTLYENKDITLLPYFRAACSENWQNIIMDVLDEILIADVSSVTKTRTLSNMADLLSIMAGKTGGLRSGPGSNPAWSMAFTLLLKGEITEGMEALRKERSNWLDRPDHLMRAARHYERAAQVLIQNSVKTAKKFMTLSSSSLPEIGIYITAECPARIDLQGGWSDTPPICYELGGSVVNIAVLIDGKKPIGAKACRTKEPYIKLKIGLCEMCCEVLVKNMKDILNYDQPNAKGALLKACLLCAGIIDVPSELTLSEQLQLNFGGGFEVQSWSTLPQGCGMGTSSILAGAIMSVLWSVTGKIFDKSAVVHAVLYVEQLLTTGGGWQDQVSGIMGGVNRGYSDASLPLCVRVEPLFTSTEIVDKLNAHLYLIYTGKVRLAKNLLQNVIRNWYAREEIVVKCFKDLILHSNQMKRALQDGDFVQVGILMNKYWEQKKVLAPGCEPASVKIIMDALQPLCYGQILVGAGGGGFMCILTKEPNVKELISAKLSGIGANLKLCIHTISIDPSGLDINGF